MKKLVLGLSAAVVAVAGAGVLCAAAPAGPAADPARFAGGPNGDGTITWADAKAQADALWQRMDVNKDGKIDQADRDARLIERFDAIDANHDGVISRDEFLAHHRAMKPGHGPHAGPDGAMPPPPPPGSDGPGSRDGRPGMPPRPAGMGLLGPVLHDALRDKDGAVTRAAYDAAVKSQFDKADTNHDGKLTRDEIRAAFGRNGGPHGAHKGGPRGRDGERMDGPPPPPGDGDDMPPPPPPAGN
ncbi:MULTISPECIES: EF-hand domain-containing protein [unclassified Sphingomonas]|uniref:EF-hand domain-containing protein n=1 Tax=Novosphingobium rhizosphaerae TaxID=1551649 RepID=UPI0015CD29BE